MTTIEVFADVRCPFTHVGLRRFVERRRSSGQDDVVLRIRAWPLELVNAEPLDADLVGEEVDELRSQLASDLFAGFEPGLFPTTSMPAMMYVASAYEAGLAAGEALSLSLRDAMFEGGRDIADSAVLSQLAAAVGTPEPTARHRDAVLRDWEEGRARGVIGSPHFFVADTDFFCPSLEITRHDGKLHISIDRPAFEEFLHACFSG